MEREIEEHEERARDHKHAAERLKKRISEIQREEDHLEKQ